ncbi:MAG TPA: ABC transporter substrate-binding protein [Micromonosporaceae bacterium]
MSQMDRRQVLRLLAALGATGLITGCATDLDDDSEVLSDEPVRIGLIIPESGRNKPIGDDVRRGLELFLSLNDNRLGGHPVELLIADEGDSVKSALAAVDSLIKKDVLALTGVVDSAIMLGIRDAVEQAKVPLIGSAASPTALQGVVYIWRTSYVDHEFGQAMGAYVARQVPRGTVAIVAEQYSLGQDVTTGFRQSFGESDPRIAEQTIWAPYVQSPRPNSYSDQIRDIERLDPEAVFCAFSGPAAVAFIKQLRAKGYENPIFGPGFLTEGKVLDELGADALGIRTALNYSADLRNAANGRFVTAWSETHDTQPTAYAVSSYDAGQVLDKAIRLAGPRLDRQELLLALGKVGQIDSPRGAWQFNQPRTPLQTWYLREVRRDGQLLSNLVISELAILG